MRHSDIIDTRLTRQMSGGSLTWHVFPPSWNIPVQGALKKILDVGCGSGAWVIEAAKCWRGCEIFGECIRLGLCVHGRCKWGRLITWTAGLDIVPLHPNFAHVSKNHKDLAKRVHWVQANL